MAYQHKVIKPNFSEACFCGSGKKFGACCRSRLPGFDIGKKYTEACKAKSWEVALLVTRADITQYTIWHKSNTEPYLHVMKTAYMLRVDINALGSYIERLQWLYMQTGREEAWLNTLDALRDNIKQRPWRRKIAYFRALHFLRPGKSNADARRELKKAGPVTLGETDVELLQLFIDLELDSLPLAEKLQYLDRILEVSDELGDQLQYRCVKAIQFFLVGDDKSAEKFFDEAVAQGRSADNQPLKSYERRMFARAVQHLGMLRHDHSLLNEAIGLFNDLLMDGDWTPVGEAALHCEIGETYKFLEDWSEAEHSHRAAIKLSDNPIDRIHLAEALLYQKKIVEACAEVDLLDLQTLSGSALEDYSLANAVIAIWSGKKERMNGALAILENYRPEEPYFRERRLQILRSLDKAISEGNISAETKTESAPKGGFLSILSKFVMIQPNIAGFGLNFNALLDEIASRRNPKPPVPDQHGGKASS